MIGDVIDTFRNITPAANQEFVRRRQMDTIACHKQGITLKNLICQSCLFKLCQNTAQCLGSFRFCLGSKQREKEQLNAKKAVLTVSISRHYHPVSNCKF